MEKYTGLSFQLFAFLCRLISSPSFSVRYLLYVDNIQPSAQVCRAAYKGLGSFSSGINL